MLSLPQPNMIACTRHAWFDALIRLCRSSQPSASGYGAQRPSMAEIWQPSGLRARCMSACRACSASEPCQTPRPAISSCWTGEPADCVVQPNASLSWYANDLDVLHPPCINAALHHLLCFLPDTENHMVIMTAQSACQLRQTPRPARSSCLTDKHTSVSIGSLKGPEWLRATQRCEAAAKGSCFMSELCNSDVSGTLEACKCSL